MKMFSEDMGEHYGKENHDEYNDEVGELKRQIANLIRERSTTERKPCLNEYCISCKYLYRSKYNESFICSKITLDSYEARLDCSDEDDPRLEIYNPAKFGCILYSERYINKGE